jgi:LuxR family transcriptional regulator, maltose regulon positive regulatory protein
MFAVHALHLLVPTKLIAPQPLSSWVCRHTLLHQLHADTSARIVLVVAPAGFGKSTFVSQWLTTQERAVGAVGRNGATLTAPPEPLTAWLTLDEHDQDPLRFVAYLVGAIMRVAPAAVATTADLLAAREALPIYVLLQALLVDLDGLPGGITLVLDDYHAITSREIHQLVAYLIRHLPDVCRLVLLSRTDPALPLARLRAEHNLFEVRADQLRFSEPEAEQLLYNLSGTPPEPGLLREIYTQTDGWPLALQLAALARADGVPAQQALGTARRQIAEYLTSEVLARQSEATQQHLLALAIPDRFSVELCAALLGPHTDRLHAESLLEHLVRANLFLVPLDSEGHWYRFHHLFRDLLLRRLRISQTPEQIRTLTLRAAHYLADVGMVEEAVRLFIAADAVDAAADLIEQRLVPELDRDVSAASSRYWLNLLPAHVVTVVTHRLGLTLIVARMAVFNLDLPGLEQGLARVEALLATQPTDGLLPELWPSFLADLKTMRGILAFWKGQYPTTISLLREALQDRPTPALASQALFVLGLAYAGNGSPAEGIRLVETELPQLSRATFERTQAHQQTCLTWLHQIAGDLAAQERAARRLANLALLYDLGDLWIGYAGSSLAMVAYERSDLHTAAAQFEMLAQRKYKISHPGYITAVIGLAMIALAQNAFAEAERFAHEAQEFATTVGGAYLRHLALGCAIRIALAQGNTGEALRAADQITTDLATGLNLGFEIPRLSQARAFIASNDPLRLIQAEAILHGYLDSAEQLQHQRLLIHTLAVQALLHQAQGQLAAAQQTLERAVTLAAPRGFLRTFLDLGAPMHQVLTLLAAQDGAPACAKQVLAAFTPTVPPPTPQLPALAGQPRFPEMLTRREIEILGFLAQRWSDKEIAGRLCIAPNTVRKHTSTIYNKLGVSGRREAVAMARTLGLLTATTPVS